MIPTRDQELAVLKSVTYASLFDYPLTLAQLQQGLIGVRADADAIESWWHDSEFLQETIGFADGLFFPAGRSDLVRTRSRREAVSRALLEGDQRVLRLVAATPFVRMVALSGSLAHLNAEGSADLDLFVITAPGRVWSVTVSVLLMSKLLGWRKHLCVNYVVSEKAMTIAPKDLFSANQIIHLRPLTGHDVFNRFVKSNAFVPEFYPNFELDDPKPQAPSPKPLLERLLSLGPAQVAERAARVLYGWYLNRKAATWRSRDQVRLEDECLKLHTSSHRAETLARFDAALLAATETRRGRAGAPPALAVRA
jgi:hypothetical protein